VEDEHRRFDFATPDEEVNLCINQLTSSVGTYLYGRRMYQSMVYWETAHTVPNLPQFLRDWTRQWQAAEKIVYSRTLAEPRSVRTRIERKFCCAARSRRTEDGGTPRPVEDFSISSHAQKVALACPKTVAGPFVVTFETIFAAAGLSFFPCGNACPKSYEL
jgi:hypothetical protein